MKIGVVEPEIMVFNLAFGVMIEALAQLMAFDGAIKIVIKESIGIEMKEIAEINRVAGVD